MLIFPQVVVRHRAGLTVATDMLITLLHEYYHVIYPAVNKHSDERADLFATAYAERIIGYALLDMDLIERVRSTARARLV